MTFGNGPWKEGRSGAASLCYVGIDADTLAWVLQHHAAVGIRATLAGDATDAQRRMAADRNWDLACLAAAEADALRAYDGRGTHGLVHPPGATVDADGDWLYQVTCTPGEIGGPSSIDLQSLPSNDACADADELRSRLDAVASAGGWAIWRFDQATLEAMGASGHQALLTWLGEEHARIWCAPVRDIGTWHMPRP